MMGNTDCEFDRIQNDQGDKTLGMPGRDFLDQVNFKKCPSPVAALLHRLESQTE